jgi:hypothetical protein
MKPLFRPTRWLNRLFVDAEIQAFDEPGIALEWLTGGD